MRRVARGILVIGLFMLISAAVHAQGNGIGGVLVRDVSIPKDEEEWPQILPAGGLVAFGSGTDWSSSSRKNGQIRVHFVIREEDGGRDSGYARIPEDAVQVFNWACGEPEKAFGGGSIICNPFTGSLRWSNEWQLRFVAEGRKLAQQLGLTLIEEFSPAYKGAPEAREETSGQAPSTSSSSKCTVDQILKMKEAGLSDAQIKAACEG
jgi:hypothetical protein